MEQPVFMNRYAYVALAITALFYLAFWLDIPEGAVIAAPLVFIAQIALLIAALRSATKMSTSGKVVFCIPLVLASILTLFFALIVAAAPFVSFS